jgi:hypothetical protein
MSFAIPIDFRVLFYATITVAAIVWLAWHYSLAVESTHWPCVQGKIVKAWVKETWDDGRSYSPRVEYIYKVDGIVYTSFTLRLTGNISCGKRRAERIVSSYPGQSPVDVWYDPKKPTRATLKTGGAAWLLAALIAVGVLGPLLVFAATSEGRQLLSRYGINSE